MKVVNTFGFFVALSIGAAYWAFKKEFDRKSSMGIFPKIKVVNEQGKAIPKSEYVINGLMAFVFGYKILYLLIQTQISPGFSPPDHVFTGDGSWWMGLLLLVVAVANTYRTDKKQQALPQVTQEVELGAGVLMGTVTMVALITGFLGAKVFHLLENWNSFVEGIKQVGLVEMMLSQGGWTFYGGLICGAAGVLWFTHRRGLPWKSVLDAGAPGMMLSYGIGRFGCHFSGDGDWGIVNLKPSSILPDWAWAYKYPHNVVGRDGAMGMEYIPGSMDEYAYQLIQPVYPTPLYEALMALVLFAVIWHWARNQQWQAGRVFALYMVFAGVERFCIELIREHGDSLYRMGGMVFCQAQLISALLIIIGGAWFVALGKKRD